MLIQKVEHYDFVVELYRQHHIKLHFLNMLSIALNDVAVNESMSGKPCWSTGKTKPRQNQHTDQFLCQPITLVASSEIDTMLGAL